MDFTVFSAKWSWGRRFTIILGVARAACGMVNVTIEDDNYSVAWLSDLQVTERFRRLGLGKRLVEQALAVAKERGAATAWLRVERDAPEWLLDFYKKEGFVYSHRNPDGDPIYTTEV